MISVESLRKKFDAGVDAMRRENYSEALKCFEFVLDNDASHDGALGNAGSCAFALGDFRRTIEFMDRVLEIRPDDWRALAMRAQAADKTGDLSLAIQMYRELLAAKSEVPEFHALLIACQLGAQEFDLAERSIESALALFPNHINILALSGLCKRALGNPEEAENLFNRCTQTQAKSIVDLRTQAAAHLAVGRWQQAFKLCQSPATPDPSLHDAFGNIETAKLYLKELPTLHFMSSSRFSPRRTVMFAGNFTYIDKYFRKASESVLNADRLVNAHLHAMLPSGSEPSFLNKFVTDRISVSYEFYQPSGKTGYTTRRFCRAFQILTHIKQPMLCLDIDSKVLRSLDGLFDDLNNFDVGIYRRRSETVINQLIHAAMLYLSPTKGAMKFLAFFINYVAHLERSSRLEWYADQMGLLAADQWAARTPSMVSVKPLPDSALSWTSPQNNTLVFTYKGGQKIYKDV